MIKMTLNTRLEYKNSGFGQIKDLLSIEPIGQEMSPGDQIAAGYTFDTG